MGLALQVVTRPLTYRTDLTLKGVATDWSSVKAGHGDPLALLGVTKSSSSKSEMGNLLLITEFFDSAMRSYHFLLVRGAKALLFIHFFFRDSLNRTIIMDKIRNDYLKG